MGKPVHFADVPLTAEDHMPRRDGLEIGRDTPFHTYLDGPGTSGLEPFPPNPPCPPERVPQRQEPIPNNPLIEESGLQIFSQWGTLINGSPDPQTPLFQSYQFLRSPIPIAKGNLGEFEEGDFAVSKLWVIALWAYEVDRVANPGAPLSPLGESRIVSNVIGQGNGGTHCSKLKARLNMYGASGGTTRIVDIAEGIRLAIEAHQVQIDVLYPSPGVTNVKGNNQLQLGQNGGLILDTVVGGFITEGYAPPGLQITSNTITVRIPAGEADRLVPLPPGAREVDIYQTTAGTAAVLSWQLQRTVSGTSLGAIPLGGDRRVNSIIRPGDACSISTGAADQLFDRVITFVFRGEI